MPRRNPNPDPNRLLTLIAPRTLILTPTLTPTLTFTLKREPSFSLGQCLDVMMPYVAMLGREHAVRCMIGRDDAISASDMTHMA